jgi:hypothetical protein
MLIAFFCRFARFDGVLYSREAMPTRQSSSSMSSCLTSCVSQIHLNYGTMKISSERRKRLAAEQEDHR